MIGRRRAERPTPAAQPNRTPSNVNQAEQRDRRRKVLPIVYGGTFDLVREIGAIAGPLAYEVSTLTRPQSARPEVGRLADAVAEVVHVAAGLVAESRAADSVTRQTATELAIRPRQPAVTDDMLVSGSWSAALADYAAEVRADLRKVLGRALPPDHNGLRGQPSVSERIERALRGVDTAALALQRRIPRIRERQALPTVEQWNAAERERRESERAARRLAQIGS